MIQLTLLVLRCRDLEASRGFYAALGLVLVPEQHGTGPGHYSCQLGTTVLELYPASEPTSSVRLGVAVPDVAKVLEAIRATGGRVEREPTTEPHTALVRDPDDNPVELSQA
jgi:lactoylglutathione lyase